MLEEIFSGSHFRGQHFMITNICNPSDLRGKLLAPTVSTECALCAGLVYTQLKQVSKCNEHKSGVSHFGGESAFSLNSQN